MLCQFIQQQLKLQRLTVVSHDDNSEVLTNENANEISLPVSDDSDVVFENNVIEETAAVCKSKCIYSNPIEILRCHQEHLVCGQSQ